MRLCSATLCTRSRPDCGACPVGADCRARRAGEVDAYPGRKPKKARPLKQTTMVLALCDGAVYLERRPPTGIWGGLWSLPEVADGDVDGWCERVLAGAANEREARATLRHSFSHFDLDIHPVVVRLAAASRKVADSGNATWARLDTGAPGGVAAPVQKLIDSLKT